MLLSVKIQAKLNHLIEPKRSGDCVKDKANLSDALMQHRKSKEKTVGDIRINRGKDDMFCGIACTSVYAIHL